MKEQRGAALVIVMALLTGAMVVGVSGMQSTLVDERLAGNYSASVQAQMNAEQAAAAAAKDIKNNSYSEGKTDDDLSEFNDGREGDNKIKTKEELRNISYSEAEAEAEEKDILLEKNKNCTGEENECFYFPIKIGEKKYWAAFGAVKKKDKLISQHVVLVGLDGDGSGGESSSGAGDSFPSQDIIDAFNKYGILSDDEIDVETEDGGDIPFYGKIHGNDNDNDNDNDEDECYDLDIKCNSEGDGDAGEDSVEIPSFAFDRYFDAVRKNEVFDYVEDADGNGLVGNDNNYYYDDDFDKGVADYDDSFAYFDEDLTIKGALAVTDSAIFVDGNLTVEGSINVNAAGGVSNIIVTGDVVFDADGRDEQDEEESDDDEDKENSNPVGVSLSDTVIVSGGEVEFDAMSSQGVRNVLIMSGDEMDIYFDGIDKIYKGWFYSGDELDMEIKNSPDMTFCGSLVAQDDVDFEADPSIKKFYSSGYSEKCPEFSGFDGPLMDGAGKTGSGSVTWE